jgi:hypothetical protein
MRRASVVTDDYEGIVPKKTMALASEIWNRVDRLDVVVRSRAGIELAISPRRFAFTTRLATPP